MIELLKKLCALDGISGDEQQVRDFIISEIKDFCEYKTDALGNLICFKKGKKRAGVLKNPDRFCFDKLRIL